MPKFYLSKDPNKMGVYEIHKANCKYLSTTEDMIQLGDFSFSQQAYCEALAYRQIINGCYCCCNSIYKHLHDKSAVKS